MQPAMRKAQSVFFERPRNASVGSRQSEPDLAAARAGGLVDGGGAHPNNDLSVGVLQDTAHVLAAAVAQQSKEIARLTARLAQLEVAWHQTTHPTSHQHTTHYRYEFDWTSVVFAVVGAKREHSDEIPSDQFEAMSFRVVTSAPTPWYLRFFTTQPQTQWDESIAMDAAHSTLSITSRPRNTAPSCLHHCVWVGTREEGRDVTVFSSTLHWDVGFLPQQPLQVLCTHVTREVLQAREAEAAMLRACDALGEAQTPPRDWLGNGGRSNGDGGGRERERGPGQDREAGGDGQVVPAVQEEENNDGILESFRSHNNNNDDDDGDDGDGDGDDDSSDDGGDARAGEEEEEGEWGDEGWVPSKASQADGPSGSVGGEEGEGEGGEDVGLWLRHRTLNNVCIVRVVSLGIPSLKASWGLPLPPAIASVRVRWSCRSPDSQERTHRDSAHALFRPSPDDAGLVAVAEVVGVLRQGGEMPPIVREHPVPAHPRVDAEMKFFRRKAVVAFSLTDCESIRACQITLSAKCIEIPGAAGMTQRVVGRLDDGQGKGGAVVVDGLDPLGLAVRVRTAEGVWWVKRFRARDCTARNLAVACLRHFAALHRSQPE